MKKLAVALFLLFPVAAFAQDKIKTLDGKTIEAKILEINDEIVYKEYNYQNGPTYRIKTDEVISILLENGTEKTFMTVPTDLVYPRSILIKRGDLIGNGIGEIKEERIPYILGKDGYRSFKTGQTLRKISTPCLIAGAGAAGMGALLFATGAIVLNADPKDEAAPKVMVGSYVLFGLGLTVAAIGLPLRIISNSKFNSVVDDYNHSPHAQLAMGVTPSGVGFQLTF